MRDEVRRREIEEAAAAGEKALTAWKMQEKSFREQRTGDLRYAGRRVFTDMVKHSKMSDATAYMEDAKVSSLSSRENLGMSRFPLTCAWTSTHF